MLVDLLKIQWSPFEDLEIHAIAARPKHVEISSKQTWRIKLFKAGESHKAGNYLDRRCSATNGLSGRCVWQGPIDGGVGLGLAGIGRGVLFMNIFTHEFTYLAALKPDNLLYMAEGNLSTFFISPRITKFPYIAKRGKGYPLYWENYDETTHTAIKPYITGPETGITRIAGSWACRTTTTVMQVWDNIYGKNSGIDLHLIHLENQNRFFLQFVDPIKQSESTLWEAPSQDLDYFKNAQAFMNLSGEIEFLSQAKDSPLICSSSLPEQNDPYQQDIPLEQEDLNNFHFSFEMDIDTYPQYTESDPYSYITSITPEDNFFPIQSQVLNDTKQSDSEFSNLPDIIDNPNPEDFLFQFE